MNDNKIMRGIVDLSKHKPMTLDAACFAHKRYMEKYMLKKLGIISLDNLSEVDRARLTKEFVLCILSELSETLQNVQWKHWKSYDDFKQDVFETQMELIDILHFVFDLFHVWGMDAQMAGHFFAAKLGENIRRQEDGY